MDCRHWMLLAFTVGMVVAAPAAGQVRRTDDVLTQGSEGGSGAVRTVRVVRVEEGRPTVDGRLDEGFWAGAPVATNFVQRVPVEGAAGTERTEVRVAYDDEALYIGARLYDSAPDSIRSVLARRDAETPADELWVALDSYNDRRTAFVFVVNPSGVQSDWLIFNGSQTDRSWDAIWESATRVDEEGWTAELAIPLTQLRFSVEGEGAEGQEELVWGVNFIRHIARRNEYTNWSLIPLDTPEWVAYYGQLRGLEIGEAPRRLEVRPYALGQTTRAPVAAGDPLHSPTEMGASVGADISAGIGSDLTLTATINPDFGQVEADPSQVNLTAGEIFLPERRPFFVEGAEIFQAGFPQPFYSRRIGRGPQGSVPTDAAYVDVPETARILGAAKVSGKTAGGWSVGLLEAVTGSVEARWVDDAGQASATAVEPLTNYAVGRIARDFRDGRSSLGIMGTATNRRIGSPELQFLGKAAYVAGLDGRHRFGDFMIEGSAVASTVLGDTAAIGAAQRSSLRYFQRPDASHVEYDPTRTALSGWGSFVNVSKMAGTPWRYGVGSGVRSPGLDVNDLGFQFDADIATAYGWVGYDLFSPVWIFRRINVFLNQWNAWNFAGETIGRNANLWAGFELRNFWEGDGNITRFQPTIEPGALRGGPALMRDGRTYGRVRLAAPATGRLTGEVVVDAGVRDAADGHAASVRTRVGVRPTPGAEFSLEPSVAWNRDPDQYVATLTGDGAGPHYIMGRLEQTTAALTARLNYTFSPTLSIELYAQPFVSAGHYARFLRVADPRATTFDRRLTALESTLDPETDVVTLSEPGTTGPLLELGNPDFTARELHTNAVLRWEYRPGSTVFVVWSQGRSAYDQDGRFDLERDARGLASAPGTSVLAIKVSYWLDT